jgi:hypothetical protein
MHFFLKDSYPIFARSIWTDKTVDIFFYFTNYYPGPSMKNHFGVSKNEELRPLVQLFGTNFHDFHYIFKVPKCPGPEIKNPFRGVENREI